MVVEGQLIPAEPNSSDRSLPDDCAYIRPEASTPIGGLKWMKRNLFLRVLMN